MANRGSIPTTALLGTAQETTLKTVPLRVPQERIHAPEDELLMAASMTEAAAKYVDFKKKTDDESARLQAAAMLGSARQGLMTAKTADEFEEAAKQNENMLQNAVGADKKEADFWQNNRAKIMELNRRDVEALRQSKMIDFGKNSLNEMLADNQNVLALQPQGQGLQLLERGVNEIAQTPFLNDDEKAQYRYDYLKTGILNLAINAPDEAAEAAKKYVPDDEEILQKINRTRVLRERALAEAERRAEENAYKNEVAQAFNLWQQKERGQVNEAAYYVLSENNRADILWGEKDSYLQTPLADTYRLLRRKNSGDVLQPDEVRDAGNYLISAYRQKKIGLEEASALQNQFLNNEMTADTAVNDAIDKIFGGDAHGKSGDADAFMENKARLALEFYDAYAQEKNARVAEFEAGGGVMTPAIARRFSREAAFAVRQQCGFKESGEESVSFEALNEALHVAYHGQNTAAIWQRFYQDAPYAEDKLELMKKMATAQQRTELYRPRFDSYEALKKADLAAGTPFYFRGRLAVKS